MTQYARPDAHHSNGVGNWDNGMMDASNLHLLIDEASADDNTTYIESSADMDTSPDTAEFTLGDVDDPESAADHKLVYKAKGSAGFGFGSAPNMTVALYQGGTAIASATNTGLSGSYATTTITLSSSEANAISDYAALSVRVTRENAGMGDSVAVTQVYFECPDAAEEEEAATSPAFLLFME